jgi:type IV pilus assembly protein PilX
MNNALRMATSPLRSKQTGATLIVGLVLLLVLTVVGVSGMNTATMELTMAANNQFQQDAFQLAEDAIDIAIGQRVYRANDQPTIVNWTGDADYDRRAVTMWQQNSNTMAPGSSIGVLNAFHFDIVAVGRGPRNAISTHTQSFYVVGNPIE